MTNAQNKTNVPEKSVTYQELERKLKENIYDQDKAIDALIQYMTIYFAKLNDTTKPIASFLFTGPSGVGKTELAKVLARELGFEYKKIDMSEFAQEHTVHTLIGAPPSYVGYNQPTILEGLSDKKTVLLLDEVEKAHPEVHRLFLQVMDNATITLSNNKKINLSNTILLMTANIGVVTSKSMGLNESKSFLTVNKEEVKKVFPPEFLGRLNGIIEFNKLENSTVAKIVGKFIREFNTKLDSVHKAHIEMSTKAVNHLIDIGYSSFFGARTIKNALNQSVFLKVARMVCDQNNISKFSVDYNSELTFDVDYHKEEPKVEEKVTQKEIADSFPEVDYERSTEQVKEETKDQATNKTHKETIVLFTNEGMLYLKPVLKDQQMIKDINEFVTEHEMKYINPNRWYIEMNKFTQSMFTELAFYTDRANIQLKCDAVHMNKMNEIWNKSLKEPIYQPVVNFYHRNQSNIELCLIVATVVSVMKFLWRS